MEPETRNSFMLGYTMMDAPGGHKRPIDSMTSLSNDEGIQIPVSCFKYNTYRNFDGKKRAELHFKTLQSFSASKVATLIPCFVQYDQDYQYLVTERVTPILDWFKSKFIEWKDVVQHTHETLDVQSDPSSDSGEPLQPHPKTLFWNFIRAPFSSILRDIIGGLKTLMSDYEIDVNCDIYINTSGRVRIFPRDSGISRIKDLPDMLSGLINSHFNEPFSSTLVPGLFESIVANLDVIKYHTLSERFLLSTCFLAWTDAEKGTMIENLHNMSTCRLIGRIIMDRFKRNGKADSWWLSIPEGSYLMAVYRYRNPLNPDFNPYTTNFSIVNFSRNSLIHINDYFLQKLYTRSHAVNELSGAFSWLFDVMSEVMIYVAKEADRSLAYSKTSFRKADILNKLTNHLSS